MTINGKIDSVVYKNDDNGYAVIRLEMPEGNLVTAVGCLPFCAPGETVAAEGKWISHPNYGEQFSMDKIKRRFPDTEDAIYEYLSSGVIRGIGAATALLIIKAFGAQTLDILEKNPGRLAEVKGINPKRAAQIGEAFSRQTGMRLLMELLSRHGISPQPAVKLLKTYGMEAIAAVSSNPYILTSPEYEVSFPLADAMALSEGMDEHDLKRLRAAILYQLFFNMEQGHCFIPRRKLLESTSVLLNGEETDALAGALSELFAQGSVISDDDPDTDTCRCYLADLFFAETVVAQFAKSKARADIAPSKGVLLLLSDVEKEVKIELAAAQREAIVKAAQSRLMMLTGGPGTGKTTTVLGMLAMFERLNMSVALAAPTGRAAKRLGEVTRCAAATIHRLLEFGPDPDNGEFRFMRDENRPLEAEVVILDEFSMVDILLFRRLIAALKPNAHLILVGDPDQLPPVGPGQVLEDFLASEIIDSVRLTEIFRQAQESDIVLNAHDVNKGIVPGLSNNTKDFFFLKRTDPSLALSTLVELCARRLPENLHVAPENIQVLTPTRKGPFGTAALNAVLRESLNPPSPRKVEKRYGELIYRESDRVMQIRNNYDLLRRSSDDKESGMGVFNGEIGVIARVDLRAEFLTVCYDEQFVDYPFESLGELEPAFAMTVHKSQGSEYGAVVLVLMRGPSPLLTRRVLYTAMTRAKDWLICVGDTAIMAEMTMNNKKNRRYSALKERMLSP